MDGPAARGSGGGGGGSSSEGSAPAAPLLTITSKPYKEWDTLGLRQHAARAPKRR